MVRQRGSKMSKRVMVLGAGLVGAFVANELHKDPTLGVSVCDNNEDNLKRCLTPNKYRCDLSLEEIVKKAIGGEDIVVNALPGFLGYQTLKTCVEAGKTVVDFSFMPEDFMELDKIAKKNGACAVADFGFAPGMCHIFTALLEDWGAQRCDIFVGGLPKDPKVEYKAVFSPRDIIEEYTRPARYIKDGKQMVEDPFQTIYPYYDLKLQRNYFSFISDGLRSLLKTSKIPNLAEYTMRHKKHFNKVKNLKEDGFFKSEHIENTAKVLIEKWKMLPEDRDISILEVEGINSLNKVKTYYMYDEHDGINHSMARVTGLPVIAMVKQMAKGNFKAHGVHAPEMIANKKKLAYDIIFFLKNHGITIDIKEHSKDEYNTHIEEN